VADTEVRNIDESHLGLWRYGSGDLRAVLCPNAREMSPKQARLSSSGPRPNDNHFIIDDNVYTVGREYSVTRAIAKFW
jgi:hypothetical protein